MGKMGIVMTDISTDEVKVEKDIVDLLIEDFHQTLGAVEDFSIRNDPELQAVVDEKELTKNTLFGYLAAIKRVMLQRMDLL